MNKDFMNNIPDNEQPVAKKIKSAADKIQISSAFQTKLESQLRETHSEKIASHRSWQTKILPSLGWAVLVISVIVLLNWVIGSLMPGQGPATNGTPEPSISFEETVKSGNICQGQLTVMHGYSVFLSNQDRNGFIKLGEGMDIGELRDFAWSPDGSQLAVVGNTRGSGNIYLTDATGTQLQPVLPNSELGYLMGVSWSHDGEQLLTWEIENNSRFYLMNVDGTGLTRVDLSLRFIETPRFAPDNESILFYGSDESSDGLFQVSLDGSQVRMLSDMVGSETSFTWSPDRSRLAYIEMESDSPSAHIVIDSEQENTAPEIYPIEAGSGSSIRDSANLSWAPDGKSLAFGLIRNGAGDLVNVSILEGGSWWTEGHAPAISADGRCLAYIKNNRVYAFDLVAAASSSPVTPNEVVLVDLPNGRTRTDIRLDKLQWMPGTLSVPDIQDQIEAVPTPSGTEYDWRGMKLYLDASLPPAPAQVGLYEAQSDRHATLESVRALAQQFGMNGQVYETPPEMGGSDENDYLVVDGSQRLRVRSNLYFSYFPDYPRWLRYNSPGPQFDQTKAENLIDDFLGSHGFDFAYKVGYWNFHDGYSAMPLTPDGLAIHYNHFGSSGFLFRFDQDGIVAVEADLTTYTLVDNFSVISANEALQKVLNPNVTAGIVEGMHAVGGPIQTWYRPRPENQTITIWGWINSVKSAEGGAPLVTFDGYRATGNLSDLAESTPNTFVEAIGQFQSKDGNLVFNVEGWQIFDGFEDGFTGTLQRDGDQVVLLTQDGLRLVLPDMPADIPLPMENAFVLGVTQGDVFEWKSIDDRMQGGGGGGGGGGGSGFYKPNLTGTPVPLPTPQTIQDVTSRTGEYIVQEGDTLGGIAETYGITVDELMQANGLEEATIFIGQTLVIPGAQEETSLVGQAIDGFRGTITVTIVNQLDGTQRIDYAFHAVDAGQYFLARLEGENLEALQAYNSHPVKIWGTVDRYEKEFGMDIPVVNGERYEILYPDQHFQILRGTQSIVTIDDKTITLFTTENGQTYAQADEFNGLIGKEGDQVLVEALVLPDENIAGYPVIQVASASMAVNPKNGEPVMMEVTADQPYVMDESQEPQVPAEITATIESVELVYFMPDQRYVIPNPNAGPLYIQPAWRFQGHYWDGSEFEILVQALKDEYLLPEIEPVEPPG